MTIVNMIGNSGTAEFVEGFPQTYLHGDEEVNSFYAMHKNTSTVYVQLDEKYFFDKSGNLGYLKIDGTIESVQMTRTLPTSADSYGLSDYGYLLGDGTAYYQVYTDGTVKTVTLLNSTMVYSKHSILHYKDEWFMIISGVLYPLIIGDGTMDIDVVNTINYTTSPTFSFLYKGAVYGYTVNSSGMIAITWYKMELKTGEIENYTTRTNVNASAAQSVCVFIRGKNGFIFFVEIIFSSGNNMIGLYNPFTAGKIFYKSVGSGYYVTIPTQRWVIADDMIYGTYTMKIVTSSTQYIGNRVVYGIGDKYITEYDDLQTVGNLPYTITTLYNTGTSDFGVTKDGYVFGSTAMIRPH